MIRLAAFAASSALLLGLAATGSVLKSEAQPSRPAIHVCANAEANAVHGACTPGSLDSAPLSPTETVLVDACATGDLHVVRYAGDDGGPVVAAWCGLSR